MAKVDQILREFNETVDVEYLESYGLIFCAVLNDIYAKEGLSWQMQSYLINPPTGVFLVAGYGKSKQSKWNIDTNLSNITAKIDTRTYDHIEGYDCVIIKKLWTKANWSAGLAWKDANDCFADLMKEGY